MAEHEIWIRLVIESDADAGDVGSVVDGVLDAGDLQDAINGNPDVTCEVTSATWHFSPDEAAKIR